MDALLFHPKLVHVPIALGVLMPFIAATLLVAWWRGWLPGRVWLLAVGLQGVLVGSGVLAMRTGGAEEDRVKRVVAERFIEEHEEAAETFVWAGGAVFGFMLLAGVIRRDRAALSLAAVATMGTILVLGLGYRTGEAGGRLVYENGAAQVYVVPAANPPAATRHDE